VEDSPDITPARNINSRIGLPNPHTSARISDVPYTRISRAGCGGLLARIVMIVFLGIVALICIANRSSIETRVTNALHGNRPKIHAGPHFTPGTTATEDGVKQTAVIINHTPHIQAISPPAAWHQNHPDAICTKQTCIAKATPKTFPTTRATDLTTALALLLLTFVTWTLIKGDSHT
jgi:hypothetical protein